MIQELVDFLKTHQESILSEWFERMCRRPDIGAVISGTFKETYRQLIWESFWPGFLDHLQHPQDDFHERLWGWTRGGLLTGFSGTTLCDMQYTLLRSMIRHLVHYYEGPRDRLERMIDRLEQEVHDHTLFSVEHQLHSKSPEQHPYRYFVENASDMIYMVDAEGKLVFCNRATEDLVGYEVSELIGKPFTKLIPDTYSKKAQQHFRKGMQGEESLSTYRMELLTKDGRTVPVELCSRTLYHEGSPIGRIGIVRNISEQTRFEQALEKQRDWFSRILNSLPERVIVYDADYNVVFCNIPEIHWRGRKCYEFIHGASVACPDAGRDHPCAVREIIHREQTELEFTYEIGDLCYQVHAAPIINLDGRRGAVEIVIDETERKKYERIEQELQETIHRLSALQITRTFGQSLDLGEIGDTLTRQLKKLLPLRAVQFWLHKDEIHDCYTFFPDLPGIPLWEAGQEAVHSEIQEVYRHQQPRVWQAAGETHLSFPLIYNGESIGVWTVSLSSEAYRPAQQEILTVIAEHVSMAVGHALLFLKERLARAAQQYLHSVLQSSSDGICIMRADGEIRYANDAIRHLLSLPAVSCRDFHVFCQPKDSVGPIHPRDIKRVLDYVLTHEHWQAELDVIEEGRVVQTYLASASLIERADQDAPDILWYIKDVTTQQRLQTQMRRAERLSAVAELASFISHEIRNPLAAIESAAEMLNGGEGLSEEDRELLRIVQSEAQRVNHLLNTYLQYARMSVPKKREVDVHQLLRDTVQFVAPSLPSNIQVKLNLESRVSVLAADALQLRQAFLNLIRNAVEAMPEGGLLEITTWWEEKANNLVIAFRDTGEGVDLSLVPKLFEPFYSTKAEGVGLGLAIVQRVVQGHDGSAEITNHPEGGAYFTLRLPVIRKEIHE